MLSNITGNLTGLFQAVPQQGNYNSAVPDTMPDDIPEAVPSSMGISMKGGGQTFSLDHGPIGALSAYNIRQHDPVKATTSSNLPQAINAHALSERVRNMTGDKIAKAWSKLQEEFKTQKLVWESMKISRGKDYQSKAETLIGILQSAIDAYKKNTSLAAGKDPLQATIQKAASLLEDALEVGAKDDGDMSKSMAEAIRFVINQSQQTKAVDYRKVLVEKIERADSMVNGNAQDRMQLTMLISSCDLEDSKLEKSIKRLFHLPVPEFDPVKRSPSLGSSASNATNSRPLGDKVSKKTSSRTKSHSVGAPVSGVKMSSLIQQLPTAPAASLGAPLGSKPIRSDLPPSEKGNRAAEKVRALASEKIETSWKTLKAEFDVQKMVWESMRLQKKVDANKTENLLTTLEGVMAARVKNPTMALKTMEQLLQQTTQDSSDLFSNGMVKAIKDNVDQSTRLADRLQLAERLSTAGVPATLPTRPSEKKQVEELVVACKLESKRLERTARELLLLPIPAELGKASGERSSDPVSSKGSGASVTKATTSNMSTASRSSGAAGSSLRSALGPGATKKTSSKRPHSTSGIKANRQNKPIAERIREDHVELPFDPPKRQMLEL